MTKKIIIKNCPFCGGLPRILRGKINNGLLGYGMGCSQPGCIAWMPEDAERNELNNYTSGWWKHRAEMVEAWNRRVNQ